MSLWDELDKPVVTKSVKSIPKELKVKKWFLPDGWYERDDYYMEMVLVKKNGKPHLDKNKKKQYIRRMYMK